MLISTGGGERGGVGASEPFGVPFGVALGVPFGAFPAFAGGFFLRAMAGRLWSANLAGSAKAVQATFLHGHSAESSFGLTSIKSYLCVPHSIGGPDHHPRQVWHPSRWGASCSEPPFADVVPDYTRMSLLDLEQQPTALNPASLSFQGESALRSNPGTPSHVLRRSQSLSPRVSAL